MLLQTPSVIGIFVILIYSLYKKNNNSAFFSNGPNILEDDSEVLWIRILSKKYHNKSYAT
jgi:hypothetical protein